MLHRLSFALAVAVFLSSVAGAQVVRFETNVGDFDLVLNPTRNPLLQGHVDNLLAYVVSGRYDSTVINRAHVFFGIPFVLQMGSFKVLSPEIPETVDGFIRIEAFPPVEGVPAVEVGLSNTIGMVGLALAGSPANQDSGTSSFYVNLNDHHYLDQDFTVFAQIANMTPIYEIMALPKVDLTDDPDFGAEPGNLAFTDVPLTPAGDLVVISQAFIVENVVELPGDYNFDGEVDAADYVVWRRSRAAGVIGADLPADGYNDGVIDQDDYKVWTEHFGDSQSGGTSIVPEPISFLLACLGLAGCFSFRAICTRM